MWKKYLSRKFILAIFILVISTIALFTNYIDGTHWAAIIATDMFSYDFSNAINRKE